MLSSGEIDALLQDSASPEASLSQPWDGLSDRARRAQALHDVSATWQELLYSGSDEADTVIQKLGDASRIPFWRLPLGDAGILDFALGILAMDNVSHPTRLHSLRLIGNCCADTDENRDRVLASNGLTTLSNQLSDDSVLPFTISVLYNILVDHEPAQLAASNAGLSALLVTFLSGPRLAHSRDVLGMVIMILEILVAHQIEASNAHPQTPSLLLNLTLDPAAVDNPADCLALTSVALAYLAYQNLQAEFVSGGNTPTLLASFYNLTTNVEPLALGDDDLTAQVTQVRGTFVQLLSDICYLPAFIYIHPLGSPVLTTLQSWLWPPANASLQAAACLCLGNVARSDEASAALVTTYQIHTPVIDIVSSQLSAQDAGALSQPPKDALLLHSALSLLKNLAIPPTNKPLLLDLLKPEMLPRIWAMDPNSSIQTPHLHFVAISLARLILTSTPTNVRALCSPLSPDPLSPLHETTLLHRVLELFLRVDSESAAHTKTEAARAALAVVRVLHTATVTPVLPDWDPNSSDGFVFRPEKPLLPPPSEASPGREQGPGAGGNASTRIGKFYRQHGALAKALAYLVTQTKFPVLRSEAWFVFALMSRIKDGGFLVVRILQVPGVWEALVTSVTGRNADAAQEAEKPEGTIEGASSGLTGGPAPADVITSPGDSTMGGTAAPDVPSFGGVGGGPDAMAVVDGFGLEPQQADPHAAAGMARVDRENGLVLVSELVRHCGSELPPSRRSALEDMIREGGELVLEDRNSDSSEGYGKGKGVAR